MSTTTYVVGDRGKIPSAGAAIALAADLAMRERRTMYVRPELDGATRAIARAEYDEKQHAVTVHTTKEDTTP